MSLLILAHASHPDLGRSPAIAFASNSMGTMTFQLPSGLEPEIDRELEHCCLVGGPDNMPFPTQIERRGDLVLLSRDVEESGFVIAPWAVDGAGLLLGSSATLMERPQPYRLLVELARGKVNQMRGQVADWQTGGLVVSDDLRKQIHDTSLALGRAVCGDPATADDQCRRVLELAYAASDDLVSAYTKQVFQIRHQRQNRLDSALSCRLDASVFQPDIAQHVLRTFTRVSLPLSWHEVEAKEASYRWDATDALLAWAETHRIDVTAGPLIDFSSSQLPEWLWIWDRDLPSMATFMCRFVEAAVRRYRSRIRRWQLTSASNWARVLGLNEEELMGLTYQLGEAARGVDPSIELILGISQPWGEYMMAAERTSPFIFADHLIRTGLNLAALNLEVVMGASLRGSYTRDRLEMSRLLDLYALLGLPIHATLGYPAASGSDPQADPEMALGAGNWHGPYSSDMQARWAEAFVGLALCKPYVQAVNWVHFSDNQPHQFPHCGLLGRDGQPRPALDVLARLRSEHLNPPVAVS